MCEDNNSRCDMKIDLSPNDFLMDVDEPDVEDKIVQHSILKDPSLAVSQTVESNAGSPQHMIAKVASNPAIVSDRSSSELAEDENQDSGNETAEEGMYWDDQILNPCMPAYNPVVPEDEPYTSDSFYVCFVCGDKFLLKSSLNFHLKRRSIQIIYHCRKCECTVVSYNRCSFLAHLQVHSDTGGISVERLQIKVIPITQELMALGSIPLEASGSSDVDLPLSPNGINYLKEAIDLGSEKISCSKQFGDRDPLGESHDECNIQVMSSKGLKYCSTLDHVSVQKNTSVIRPESVAEDFCRECKTKLTDMRKHFQRGLQSFENRHKCKQCQLPLPNQCSLSAHERCHRRQKPYVCPECGRHFELWASFLVHLNYMCFHLERCVSYKCPKCSAVFVSDKSLKTHIFSQHIKDVFKCEACTVVCYETIAVEQHKIITHGRKDIPTLQFHQCQLCNLCVTPKKQIFPHIDEHVSYSTCCVYGYKCTNCKILFEKRASFVTHNTKSYTEHRGEPKNNDTSVCNAKILINDKSMPNDNSSTVLNSAKPNSENGSMTDCSGNESVHSNKGSYIKTNGGTTIGVNTLSNGKTFKITSKTVPIRKLVSPIFLQQKKPPSLDKPVRQYVNKLVLPGTNSNKKNPPISVSESNKKEMITNSLVPQSTDKGSLSLEMQDGSFIKVNKIIRQCVSCKNDIIFSGPSLQPLPSLPSKCISCLKKAGTLPALINIVTPRSKTKTVVCLKKIEKPGIISIGSNVNSEVSNSKMSQLNETEELDHDTSIFLSESNYTTSKNLSKCNQTSAIRKSDFAEDFKLNTSAGDKDESADSSLQETVESCNTGEKLETLDPTKKRKKIKLIPKEKTNNSPAPYISGKLILPITESNSIYRCFKCEFSHNDRSEFEAHVLAHKTDSSSFQCLECGMCFIVQPSFEKHLLVSHGITDAEKYISDNVNCKEDSYDPYNGFYPGTASSDEEVDENKCTVCHDVFETSEELNIHFRVHGMAFLLKKQRELRQIITA